MNKDLHANVEGKTPTFLNDNGNKKQGRGVLGLVLMAVFAVFLNETAWGQISDGLYYLCGPRSGSGYVANNPSTYYYLCPTENWMYYQSETPYYTTTYNGQPFMTTFQCRSTNNATTYADWAVWYVKKDTQSNNYYLIHVLDNKYLTFNDALGAGNANRARVHLEATEETNLTNNALFTITSEGSGSDTYYLLHPVSDNNNWYCNITDGNKATLQADGKTDGPNGMAMGGTIGHWDRSDLKNSKWYPISNALCQAPSINYNASDHTCTITWHDSALPSGYSIKYTDNGTTNPSITEGTVYNGPFPVSSTDNTTVKAIVIGYGMVLSEMASSTIVLNPTITLDPTSFIYNGNEQCPSVTVMNGSVNIDPSEYSVICSNNINAGTATVTITDNPGGDYVVYGSSTFTISPMSIGNGGEPVYEITIDIRKIGNEYEVTVKHGTTILVQGTDYTWTIDGNELVTVTGMGNYTGSATAQYFANPPQYYAIHCNGKGYVTRIEDNAKLSIINDFRYTNSFASSSGSSIWVLTSEGYLQSDYYYLNVANDKLYLSVEPKTVWSTEDITGDTHDKKHLYTTNGSQVLYLCNIVVSNTNTIALSASPTDYYNACPLTITENENGWSNPSASTLTVQSPQQVTYLRNCFYTQKIDYDFYDDGGNHQSDTGKDRRVFVRLTFKESNDSDYGTLWNFDQNNGIIYHMQADGEVEAKATYYLRPADPIVRAAHNVPAEANVTFNLQPKPILIENDKDFLLFSIGGGENFRYPYDNGLGEGSPVKPDGKGGTTTASVLTDPDTNPNLQISWKLEADQEGFYMFKNVNTGRYLYYDETEHASSDYGTLNVGATTLPEGDTRYKFRLFKTSNGNFGTCYYILPFCKQFAVWKSDAVMSSDYIYPVLNVNQYSGQTPSVISIHKTADNSKWCIYKYEAEWRVKNDFAITGPASTNVAGNNTFKTQNNNSWYAKCIIESPATGGQQTSMVISGTYNSYNSALMNYVWTVDGINDYISITNGQQSGTQTSVTINANPNLVINVTSLPTTTATGTIQLILQGGDGNTYPIIESAPKSVLFFLYGDGTYEWVEISELSQITSPNGAYKLTADNTYSSTNKPEVETFSGILDCDGHSVTDLTAPLFTTLNNGTVCNLNLKDVVINGTGPTGAIAGTANGASRIYNCGILPESAVGSSDGYCGGLVGWLKGSARVINCFSYATITGGTTVGGLVGYNDYASTMNDLRTMVVNCMFYGEITGGTTKYPVYGGNMIVNSGSTAINNYNYFCANATFYNDYEDINNYNRSWPVEERFLNRFDYYRSILNSNRRLCTWWVNGTSGTAPTDDDIAEVGIAKWVLDPSIAPYPILKPWGKYPSVFYQDPDNVLDGNNQWIARTSAPDYRGKKLGELTVTVKAGTHNSGAADKTLHLPITDMDTLHHDYSYYKVQLPYYNEQFGNPNGTTHAVKYGNNYTDEVVTGWKITSVTGGTQGTFNPAWEDGCNFADRFCTDKDKYSVSGRVFAQGGYYYVPEGVTAITIEAYWGKAVYVHNDGHYIDRMNLADNAFTPAGKFPTTFNGQTVKTNIKDAINSSGLEKEGTGKTVYDQAIVLVGNLQHKNLGTVANYGYTATGEVNFDENNIPFTLTTVDLDFDNEPDYCFEWQFSIQTNRLNLHPIRFDFLPVPDLGMAIRTDAAKQTIGVFAPRGHFEITETSFFHTGQFEYDGRLNYRKKEAPLILNGGQFEQFVSSNNWDRAHGTLQYTKYIILGGNVWMKEFTPGKHGDINVATRHCAVSVMGGEFQRFCLSGVFINTQFGGNEADNPHCYTNGGRFGTVSGAGYEDIQGSVTFKIDHSLINEFYGGGLNAARHITGSIDVTINNSIVGKYCGGPKTGDMEENTSVTTVANNTVFGYFYGGGDGGTNFNRNRQYDSGNSPASDVTNENWRGLGQFDNFTPLAFVNTNAGYQAQFEFELIDISSGSHDNVVMRTYRHEAQFTSTMVRTVTSTLNDCTVRHNFYGGGNLGKVKGDVFSTLTNTNVMGSAFGGGYSAATPSFAIHDKNTVIFPTRDFSGFNHAGSLDYVRDDGEIRYYKWINVLPDGVSATTSNPAFQYNGEWYCYTEKDMQDLGAVEGDATLTLQGTTTVGKSVFGGGDESTIGTNSNASNTLVKVLDRTKVFGNVYGGGNMGKVFGDTKVVINGNNN